MTVTSELGRIRAPADRWDDAAAAGLDGVEAVVYRSNLLGADRALANRGGGNTSAKGIARDHLGRDTPVLWVKGSGTDLATITASGFAALRLEEVVTLRGRDAVDDAEMVDFLRHCALGPDQPRPSIETLLHAFVGAAHVDHTHPDAVIALTSSPDGRALARAAFGSEAVWLDYQRPGFAMSKRIAELLDAHPEARAVLLERHGLVTWGETSAEAYQNTLEFVSRSAEALATVGEARLGLGGAAVRAATDTEADAILATALPALRGELLSDGPGVILEVDRAPEAVAFVSSARGLEVSQVGAPCPDHLINTKHRPLVVEFDPDRDSGEQLAERLRDGVRSYAGWYRDYYERNLTDESRPFAMDPPGPRVILVPAVGVITAGSNAARARFSRELYERAVAVESAAEAAGGFRSLSEAEAFAVEYWPLERYKLTQAPAPSELSGRVALVTGAASGIGRAASRRLAELGAVVAVADLDADGADVVASELTAEHGERSAVAVPVDVTDEKAVEAAIREVVLAYGGLDILVCSAGIATSAPVVETTLADWERSHAILARGYFLAAREAFRVFLAQERGGSVVFVGSKNALVAGSNASAYSSAKAAALHLARCLAEEGGPHGIRVNTVNPDAVIEGSSIWSSEWKAERANTYGVSEEDLPAYYRSRTALGVNVSPEDVAEAIAFLAGPWAAKSTGNVLNVDGGVRAAYPR